MMNSMQQYHNLLREVMICGYEQDNRTDQGARTLPYGTTMRFDMAEGFPAPWTKELFFPGIRGEIIGFMRGYTNSDDFKKLGCSWWEADANENKDWLNSPFRKGPGDMGKVYGYQWRNWETDWVDQFGCKGVAVDQLQVALDKIRDDPYSRRIIISAWRPDHFAEMCLPPCHVLYRFQVNVAAGELNMSFYQRSSDMFLGVPMNIAGAALLLNLVAKATGLKPRWLTHHLDDTHIYAKAVEAASEQLDISRNEKVFQQPTLSIACDLFGANADELAAVEPSMITLQNYQFHQLKSGRVKMATSS